jgi:8-hydroxy-5-deazaflavin:NADPH oxidoreductase
MIGIVGGTGDFGQGLAERLRRLGEDVQLGSRTPRDEFVSNRDCAAKASIVFLSVPPEGLVEMCGNLAAILDGKIVVSVASPIVFTDGKPAAEPGALALAELAAQAAPGARMVGGFHTVSAKALARVDEPLDEDVLLCGDDEQAKAVVAELAERLVEGRAVDAGRLEVARWLEPLTAVLLNVNRRYKVSSGVKVTGLQ